MRACEGWTLRRKAVVGVLGVVAVLGAVTTGCTTVMPPPAPMGAPPPPPAAAAPPPAAAPVPIACTAGGRDLGAEPGQYLKVACPAGCEGRDDVRGTMVYTAGSLVCRAAIHAGAIGPAGGVVSLRIDPERAAFRGSERNGVRSVDSGAEPFAVAVLVPGVPPPAVLPSGAGAEAGCTFTGRDVPGEPGRPYQVACPPGCAALDWTIHGTDVYGFNSSVCKAAIHAGVVTDKDGGMASVVVGPGQPAYRGSKRNNIRSSDGESGDMGSFRVARP